MHRKGGNGCEPAAGQLAYCIGCGADPVDQVVPSVLNRLQVFQRGFPCAVGIAGFFFFQSVKALERFQDLRGLLLIGRYSVKKSW